MSLIAQSVSSTKGGHEILSNVDLAVQPGTVTALIGPNGAGKSTLLKLMSGDEQPDRGHVLIEGLDVGDLSSADLAQHRSVMTQSLSVVFDFYTEEILSLGWLQDETKTRRDLRQALEQVTEASDIGQLLGRIYRTLSGGEQQRVQFARALLQIWRPENRSSDEVKYVLLDEPTSNLDVAHELAILKQLQLQSRKGVGVLIVLHDLNLAARFADRICILSRGQVVANGTPEDVLTDDLLSDVYKTPILTERHQQLDQLVIYTR
ncbi:MAG: heme ABC transporter ATP-binding protein [Pseudomonadota bacterium]